MFCFVCSTSVSTGMHTGTFTAVTIQLNGTKGLARNFKFCAK